eukprot:4892059-Pleurochrysis_carterae.AAC.1
MPLSSLSRAHASEACAPPQVPEDERVYYKASELDNSKQPAAAQAPAREVRPPAASEARPSTASKAQTLTATEARPPPTSEA